jgi:hypothetical protein
MMQKILLWNTSTTCIGQSFQTFIRKLDVRASRTKKEGEAKEHPKWRNGKEYRESINEQFPLILKALAKRSVRALLKWFKAFQKDFPFSMVKDGDRGEVPSRICSRETKSH